MNIQIQPPSLQASGTFSDADCPSSEGEVSNTTVTTQKQKDITTAQLDDLIVFPEDADVPKDSVRGGC